MVSVSRIFTTSVASVYPHYVNKVEKKGRTTAELDEVICWLTGFDQAALAKHIEAETTFEDFFAAATLNPNAALITGLVCGVRVEDIEDKVMRRLRYLDKLIDAGKYISDHLGRKPNSRASTAILNKRAG